MSADEFQSGGKKFISSKLAAGETGYTTDYIGQLCRKEKIPARLIGKTWFVDVEALIRYQRDALLSMKERGKALPKLSQPGISPAEVFVEMPGEKKTEIPPITKEPVVSEIKEPPTHVRVPESEKIYPPFRTANEVKAEGDAIEALAEKLAEKLIAKTSVKQIEESAPKIIPQKSPEPIFVPEQIEKPAKGNYPPRLYKPKTHLLTFLVSFLVAGGMYALADFASNGDLSKVSVDFGKSAIGLVFDIGKNGSGNLASVGTSGTAQSGDQKVLSVQTEGGGMSIEDKIAERVVGQLKQYGLVMQPSSARVVERIIERQTIPGVSADTGITKEFLDARLSQMEDRFRSAIFSMTSQSGPAAAANFVAIAPSNRIDQLSNVAISNSTITGVSSFSGSTISAASGTFGSLAVSDLSTLASLDVLGNLSLGGNLLVSDIMATGTVTVKNLVATASTTVNDLAFVNAVGVSATTTNVFTYYLNANNISGGVITATSSATLGTTTITNLSVINTSTSTFAGGLTVVGNIGIGTTSPTAQLHVGSLVDSNVVQKITGTTGQTADLLQLQKGSDTRALVDSGGSFRTKGRYQLLENDGLTVIQGLYQESNLLYLRAGPTANRTVMKASDITNIAVFDGATHGVGIGSGMSYSSSFSTNGLVVEGNVGIGTTSPVAKLQIETTTDDSEALRFTNTANGNSFISFPRIGDSTRGLIIGHQTVPGDNKSVIRACGGVSEHICMTPGLNMAGDRGFLQITSSNFYTTNTTIGTGGTSTPWAKLSVAGSATDSTTPLFTVSSSTPTGTSTVFHITPQGNVGIGTTTPLYALSVNGDVSVGDFIHFKANPAVYEIGLLSATNQMIATQGVTSGSNDWFVHYFGGSTNKIYLGDDGTNSWIAGGHKLFIRANMTSVPSTAAIPDMTISSGNVGIGTTSPWAQFSVNPNNVAGPAFAIGSSTKTDFVVTNGGNVGIGTTNPDTALNVNGITTLTRGAYDQALVLQSIAGSEIMRLGAGPLNGAQAQISAGGPIHITPNGSGIYDYSFNSTGIHFGSNVTALYSSADYQYLELMNGGSSPYTMTAKLYDNSASFLIKSPTSEFLRVGLSSYFTGNLGIGTTSPYSMLSVAGQVVGQNFVATSTTATSTFTGGATFATGGGNVGIGTTTPGEKVDINGGNIRLNEVSQTGFQPSYGIKFRSWQNGNPLTMSIQQGTPDSGAAYLDFIGLTSNVIARLIHDGRFIASSQIGAGISGGSTANDYIHLSYAPGLGSLWTGNHMADIQIGNNWMRFSQATGNVGIGTSSPYSKLSVAGQVVGQNFVATSTTATSTFAGGLAVGSNSLSVLQNGKVGIGNSNPIMTLDVTGTGRFSSTLTISNVTTCTGGQALQTDGSGNVACGAVNVSGASVGGGWATNNIGSVTLATTTDRVAVGASTTPYAKLTVLSGSVSTTTFALVPSGAQTANIIDIYNTSDVLSSVMTAGGNLGLGTTSPTAQLEVKASGSNVGLLVRGSSGAQFLQQWYGGVTGTLVAAINDNGNFGILGGAKIFLDGAAANGTTYIQESGGLNLVSGSGRDIILSAGANGERIRVKNDTGNVGIGTTSPVAKLEVYKSGSSYQQLANFWDDTSGAWPYISVGKASGVAADTGAAFGYNPSGNHVFIGVLGDAIADNGQGLVVKRGGNVGIGTTTPGAKLDVAGNSRFNGQILGDTAFGFTGATFQDTNSLSGVLIPAPVNGGYVKTISIDQPNAQILFQNQNVDLGIGGGIKRDVNYNTIVFGNKVGAGGVRIDTGGNPRMFVDSSGNVGVGSTTPWAQLSVNPNGVSGPAFAVGSSTATKLLVTNSGQVLIGTTTTYLGSITSALLVDGGPISVGATPVGSDLGLGSMQLSSHLVFKGVSPTRAQNAIIFAANTGSRIGTFSSQWLTNNLPVELGNGASVFLGIDSSGNVGIGTTSPYSMLSVAGQVVGQNFVATSSNSTSTFAGGITGSNSFTVQQNSGNVGIGIANPIYPLQVGGLSYLSGGVRTTSISDNGISNGIVLNGSGITNGAVILESRDGGTILRLRDNNSNTVMIAQNSGLVGIGTSTPSGKLSIAGLSSENGQPLFIVSSSTPTSTTTAFIITAKGNVGIGTANPSDTSGTNAKLQVRGGRTYLNSLNNDVYANFAIADLVLGDNQTPRNGVNGTNGSNLFLQARGKSTISFLDDGNNVSQLSYQNLLFTIGENAGYGFANANFLGNVGIGSTSPSQRLSVAGNGWFDGTVTATNITATGTMAFGTTTLANLSITNFSTSTIAGGLTVGTSQFVVQQATGNVGIGTANPSELLTLPFSATTNRITFQDPSGFSPYIGGATGSGVGQGLQIYSPGGIAFSAYASNSAPLSSFNHPLLLQPHGVFSSYPYGLRIYLDGSYGGAAKTGLMIDSFASNTSPLIDVNSGATNVFRIQPSGNVGIGTTTPSAKLNVLGGTAVTGLVPTGTTGAIVSDNLQTLGSGSGSMYGVIGVAKATADASGDKIYAGYFKSYATGFASSEHTVHIESSSSNAATPLEVYQGSNALLTIDGGNGGTTLGTNAGTAGKLTINGAADSSSFNFLNVSKGAFGTIDFTQFYTSGSNYGLNIASTFYVNKGTGNVGIGTTTPNAKLGIYDVGANSLEIINNNGGTGGTDKTLIHLQQNTGGAFGGGAQADVYQYLSGVNTRNYITQYVEGGVNIGKLSMSVAGDVVLANQQTGAPQTQGLALQTNNTTRLYVNYGGNVGIGTTTPQQALEVKGFGRFSNSAVTAGYSGIEFAKDGTVQWQLLNNQTTNAFGLWEDGTTQRLTVLEGGNVGIGTTNPQVKLDVQGIASSTTFYANAGTAVAPSITFSGDTNTGIFNRSANVFSITTNGVNTLDIQPSSVEMRSGANLAWSGIDDAGSSPDLRLSRLGAGKLSVDTITAGNSLGTLIADNVGIGTTSPYSKLSVAGQVVGQNFVATSSNSTSTFIGGATFATGGGSVGIGTASPGYKLEVSGTSDASGGLSTTNGIFSVLGSATNALHIGSLSDSPFGMYLQTNGAGYPLVLNPLGITANGGGVVIGGYSAGTARLAVMNGNVGIGTTSPLELLHVAGVNNTGVIIGGPAAPTEVPSGVYNYLKVIGHAAGIGRGGSVLLGGGWSNNNGGPTTVFGSVNGFKLVDNGSTKEGYLSFGTNTGSAVTEKMRIDNLGNVGIGTTTPANNLTIYDASKADIGFSGESGPNYKWTIGEDMADSGKFKISSSTALGTNDRFVIDGNGSVGIGTTSPSGSLSVLTQLGAPTGLYVNRQPVYSALSSTERGAYITIADSSVGVSSVEALRAEYNQQGIAGGIAVNGVINANQYFNHIGVQGIVTRSTGHVSYQAIGVKGVVRTTASPGGANYGGWFENDYDTTPTVEFWNASSTGNNILADFSTEGSITSRGSIRYDRTNNALGLLGVNALTMSTAGNVRMAIANGGNIGIGTATMGSKLEVLKDSTYNSESAAGFAIKTADATYKKLLFGVDSVNNVGYVQSMAYNSYGSVPLAINPNGGNVGIGTTTPGGILSVANSSGAEQLRVGSTASAVNYLNITGATTGSGPVISSAGADSPNIDINYVTKGGNGLHNFKSGTNVNYLTMQGSGAGNGVTLGTAGTDANVDLMLSTKAAGNIYFTQGAGVNNGMHLLDLVDSVGNQGQSSWPKFVTGYTVSPTLAIGGSGASAGSGNADFNFATMGTGAFKFKTNSTVEQVRILNTASATNYLTFTGSNGGSPTISTNAGNLSLAPAGGNVGIGTTSPYRMLSVQGSGIFTGGDVLASTFTATSTVFTAFVTGTTDLVLNPGSGNTKLMNSGGGTLLWYTGAVTSLNPGSDNAYDLGTSALRVRTGYFGTSLRVGTGASPETIISSTGNSYFGGNVGIGSTTPWAQLSVNSDGVAGPEFAVGSSTRTDFVVTNGGKVGIGTTTPGAKLEIADTWNSSEYAFEINASAAGNYYFAIEPFAASSGNVGYKFKTHNNGSEVDTMSLTGAGLVGIGTTTPASKLNVLSTTEQLRLSYDQTNSSKFTVGSDGTLTLASGNGGATKFGNVNAELLIRGDGSIHHSGSAFYFGSATALPLVLQYPSGSVGIGTTTPGRALTVSAGGASAGGIQVDGTASPAITMSNAGAIKAYLGLATTNDAFVGTTGYVKPGDLVFRTDDSTNGNIWFSTQGGSAVPMAILRGGNVGIGTTTPSDKLEVSGGNLRITNGSLYLNNSYGNAVASIYNGAVAGGTDIRFRQASVDNMIITSSGNVGVGITPTASYMADKHLEVSGGALFGIGGAGASFGAISTYTNTVMVAGAGGASSTAAGIQFGDNNSGSSRQWGIYNGIGATGSTIGSLNFVRSNLVNTDALGAGASSVMTLTSGGNVGIGTSTPSNLLTLERGSTSVFNETTFANQNTVLDLKNFATETNGMSVGLKFSLPSSAGGETMILAVRDTTASPAEDLYFTTRRGGTRSIPFVIKSGGNVGIGTTTPQRTLSVKGDALIGSASNGTGNPGAIDITTSVGSPFSGKLQYGTDGTGWKFAISKNQAGAVTDQLTIQDNGNVGIGTTTPAQALNVASGNGNIRLTGTNGGNQGGKVEAYSNGTLVGTIAFGLSYNAAAAGDDIWYHDIASQKMFVQNRTGGVYLTDGATSWTANSDERLKTNIQLLSAATGLDAIRKLLPVSYNWKDVKQDGAQGTQFGFVAQDVQQVFPQLVTTGGTTTMTMADGSTQTVVNTLGLNVTGLISPLVEAVQELDKRTNFISNAGANITIGTTTKTSVLAVLGSVISSSFSTTDIYATSTIAGSMSIGTSTPVASTLFSVFAALRDVPALFIDKLGGVAIGTTTPDSALTVEGTVHITGTTTLDNLLVVNTVAQNYISTDTLEAGDIVSPGNFQTVTKASSPTSVIGVVTNNSVSGNYPVATAGKTKVKVNTEGGDIYVGDRITLSSQSGVGTKATTSAMTVGIALENSTATSSEILVQLNLSYVPLTASSTNPSQLLTLDGNTVKTTYNLDLGGNSIQNVKSIVSANGNWGIDENGKLTVIEINADRITAKIITTGYGVTIKDKDSGDFYCIQMSKGTLNTIPGICQDDGTATAIGVSAPAPVVDSTGTASTTTTTDTSAVTFPTDTSSSTPTTDTASSSPITV